MPYTPTRLYQGQLPSVEVTATPGLLSGAVPASTTWIIKEVILCNTSTTTDLTTSLSVVPSGGTGGATTRIISSLLVAAGQSVTLGLATVLTTGDFLTGVATLGSTCTLTISGVVVT